MSKSKKRTDKHEQLNFFDLVKKLSAADVEQTKKEGSLNIGREIRLSLSQGIKQCPLSRRQIAGEMSHAVNADVTVTMIDFWTAESKEKNRIPAEYVPAFCVVTGYSEPLKIISEAAGMFMLPGSEALRSEIQRYREQEKNVRAEVKKRERLLDELERRR